MYLGRLTRLSLISFDDGLERYSINPLLRAFALEKSGENKEKFNEYENKINTFINKLYNYGISLGINTDARTLTNISLSEEYSKSLRG